MSKWDLLHMNEDIKGMLFKQPCKIYQTALKLSGKYHLTIGFFTVCGVMTRDASLNAAFGAKRNNVEKAPESCCSCSEERQTLVEFFVCKMTERSC